MKLVIFDLDQTLVDFIAVYDTVVLKLFKEFFNVEARLTDIDFAGRSLNDSFTEIARLKKIPEAVFLEKSGQLLEKFDSIFVQSLPAGAAEYILPGAEELLKALSGTEHIVALYTGSSRGIVGAVFKATGLGKYFKFCQYGTEVAARADMVRQAIEKARKLTGREFKNKDIVIIGDSVRDIACGKEFNARVIAVATGFHTQAQLAAARPDYLFTDLKDTRLVIEAIQGSVGK